MTDPPETNHLTDALEALSQMTPHSPDDRDQALGLQGIGLALCDIAITLRLIYGKR